MMMVMFRLVYGDYQLLRLVLSKKRFCGVMTMFMVLKLVCNDFKRVAAWLVTSVQPSRHSRGDGLR